MAELVVGLVGTPQQWRRDLHAHVRDHVAGVRLVVLHDSSEAFTSGVDVVVVDDTMDFLTPTQALALRDQGVRVVGLYDPQGKAGRGLGALTTLGVDTAVEVAASPAELLASVATLSPARALAKARADANPSHPWSWANGDGPPGPQPPGRSSVTIAVSGGSDAPGRTETAVALAGRLAATGEPTVLVDLDEHSPSVARRLGFNMAPNVVDAMVAVQAAAPLGAAVGQRASFAQGAVPFDVVCGLANPNDWAQLRDVATLLRALRETWAFVVIDTGPSCQPEQVPPGGARNNATRTALRMADHVVAVCNPTPLGVLRLLDWASAAIELVGQSLTVVVNRAPKDRYARGQLQDQIGTNLVHPALGPVAFVAPDAKVTQAVWDGVPVRSGPFSSGVERVMRQVLPAAPAHSRRQGARA